MSVSREIAYRIMGDNLSYIVSEEFLDGMQQCDWNNFWDWFAENATAYKLDLSVDNPQQGKSFAGNCYDNAQTNALVLGLCYCEGAYEVSSNFVLHGFNTIGDSAIDFTVSANIENGSYDGNEVPANYYGVTILLSFVEQHCEIANTSKHNPLLGKYYKQLKGLL